MYINPKVSEKGQEQPLKKILMWNGMVSWSGVDIGQKEFLKQECPVNRNVIGFRKFTTEKYLSFFLSFLFCPYSLKNL